MTDSVGTTTWTYDAAGRLVSENGPFSDDTVNYTYDALDRKTSMTLTTDNGPLINKFNEIVYNE